MHFPPCPGDDGHATSPSESSCAKPPTGCKHLDACKMIKAQWAVLTEAYKKQQLRAIGVSNYCRACFACLEGSEVMPMVNQVQFHVGMGSDPEGFRTFAEQHDIKLQAPRSRCERAMRGLQPFWQWWPWFGGDFERCLGALTSAACLERQVT